MAAPALTTTERAERGLSDLVAAARQALGDTLDSIVLYGSAAEGRLRAVSDVNVIFVLNRFDPARVDAIREPVRVAQAAIRLAPMVLLRDEIPHAASAFAVKFADVVRRHRVLHGSDPFADLAIAHDRLLTRLLQVLLNLRLRLRAAYVTRSFDDQLVPVIVHAASALRSAAATLRDLEGKPRVSPRESLEEIGAGTWRSAFHRRGPADLRRPRIGRPSAGRAAADGVVADRPCRRAARARVDAAQMNPFDLPGPQFLAFYAVLGACVLLLLYVLKQRAEGGDPIRLPSRDPYLIAYLRGGAVETVRLGVAVLVDRQLLQFEGGDSVVRRDKVRPTHGGNDLERAILEECDTAVYPQKLVYDAAPAGNCQTIIRVAAHAHGAAGWPRHAIATAARIRSGDRRARHRRRNQDRRGLGPQSARSFLIVLAFGFAGVALVVNRGRLTALGTRVLADLATLFDALRERAGELRPYASTGELALLMAVFGFGAVPIGAFPFVRAFRAATTSTTRLRHGVRLLECQQLRRWRQQLRRGRQQLRWRRWMWRVRKLVSSVREAHMTDRFGLTWQPALAAGILANLDRIDVVEVIAEEQFGASSRAARALETLAHQVPLLVHGVALGPASTAPVDSRRLDRLARLVDRVEPAFWSEHLACVRAGDIEIGHLAAAPRTGATVDATAANLSRAASIVGSRPMVENIATLMDPPASDRPEAEWISSVIAASGCDLLLDLHNVHANSLNFGFDPIEYLDSSRSGTHRGDPPRRRVLD